MSYLGKIDSMPLYSTVSEVLLYGKQYNITTYHTHYLNGQLGYMAGTHDTLQSIIDQGIQVFLTPEELALGYFVTNTTERQAYIANNISNIPIAPVVVPQPEEPEPAALPMQPTTTPTTPTTSTSGGGGGGY
tara:strand:- start:230 stop:625 length:396 start_codon:yes stop_codon:yes gene_type:complete